MRADLLVANRSDTWTYQVLHALQDFPTSQQFLNAIRSHEFINLKQFELTMRERIIGSWRELDNLTPHDKQSPFQQNCEDLSHKILVYLWGLLLAGGMTEKEKFEPVLPIYLCLDISNNLSRALPCLRLSGHNFLVQRMRHNRNRRPYELKICDHGDWHTVQDEEHMLHEHLVSLHTQHRAVTASLSSHPSIRNNSSKNLFESAR